MFVDATTLRQMGRELRGARERKGLSQLQLAALLNCTQGAIAHWENGRREPDLQTQITLRVVLDQPALFTGVAAA